MLFFFVLAGAPGLAAAAAGIPTVHRNLSLDRCDAIVRPSPTYDTYLCVFIHGARNRYGQSVVRFANDIRLVWRNGKRYNKEGSEVSIAADKLAKAFDALLEKWVMGPWRAKRYDEVCPFYIYIASMYSPASTVIPNVSYSATMEGEERKGAAS